MKATMKKILAVMLAMVLLSVPVVAFAAAGDSEAEAIPVTETATVTVPAGATVYYAFNGMMGMQYSLTVTGVTGFAVNTTHPMTGMPMPNYDYEGVVAIPVTAGPMWATTPGVANFSITNYTESEQTYTIEIVLPKGTQDNPEELVIGATDSYSADGSAYWYTWTAAEDGVLLVDFTNFGGENGWEYTIVVNGEYITSHTSSEAEGDPSAVSASVEMLAGDVLLLGINNYDWIPGILVNFETSFTAGAIDDDQPTGNIITSVEFTTTVEIVAGTTIFTPVLSSVNGDADLALEAIREYVAIWYNTTDWTTYPSNTVLEAGVEYDLYLRFNAEDGYTIGDECVVTFVHPNGEIFGEKYAANCSDSQYAVDVFVTPSTEGEGEGDVNYEEMYIALQVGTDSYTASMMYGYSIYTFEPTEEGKYTFSSTDSLLGIVSYNGMWITIDPSAESVAENSFVWECTSVGQSIWVAAMPETNVATITIEKEDINIVETPTTEYENKVTPEDFTFNGNAEELLYVDIEDDVVDSAVLGEDGFYHLNSADGPILYVDLNDELMNLVDAMGFGQLNYVVTEDGEAVEIIDYNAAFGAYAECADEETGLYPLTEDLMEIYKKVGEYQGWYGENGWVGGTEEDSWMFACYYLEGEEEPVEPGDASNVIVFVVLAIVAIAGSAIVVKTRK